MSAITIHQVAKEAGVSTASVSRILRGGAGYTYPAETEARVREAAELLGYQANAAARMLRQQNTNMIGLGTEVTARPHISHLVVTVHDELRRRGYEPIRFEPTQLVPTKSHAPFPSLEMLAGMLCVEFSLEEQFPEICEMVYSRVPVVALYPTRYHSTGSIFTDLSKGIEIAVAHLVEIGHQRIAFTSIRGGFHPAVPLKMQGWLRAVDEHALSIPEGYVITADHKDRIPKVAEKAMRQLLRLSPGPTAVVCESDELALCLIGQLSRAGVRVPADISVVGFDGIELGEYTNPPLTTVAQPVEDIAKGAVENLVEQISNRAVSTGPDAAVAGLFKPMRKLIEPKLLVRGSTAAPKNKGEGALVKISAKNDV